MALPAIVPFQFSSNDWSVQDDEWVEYLAVWNDCTKFYLGASDEQFSTQIGNSDSLPEFLRTYVEEQSQKSYPLVNDVDRDLSRNCFSLTHRIWFSLHVPPSLKTFFFLSNFALLYGAISASSQMLDSVWQQENLDESHDLQQAKQRLMSLLDQKTASSVELNPALFHHTALAKQSASFGRFLLVGSDLLDSLCAACRRQTPENRHKISTLTFVALHSLFRGTDRKVSLLLDHLYSLHADHQSGKDKDSLLRYLVTATPLIYQLRRLAASSEVGRVKSMLVSLESVGTPPAPRRKPKSSLNKGKAIAQDAFAGAHIHNEAQISQIQELFPDLGSGFIAKLLDAYSEDVEQVTAHLLEDSLPPHLRDADRTAVIDPTAQALGPEAILPPRPPAARRNVFDNDALDKLSVSASQLHIGHRNEDVLSQAPNKASILSALAAIDLDDDERDDTYDIEDVGGTVDTTLGLDGDEEAKQAKRIIDAAEETLWHTWKSTPEIMARDAFTRRGQRRQKLRGETGMTDEAIEGWALMLERDPGRQIRLQAKYSAFSGEQASIRSTKWRAEDAGAEDGEGAESSSGRGGFRGGRGSGRGRGRGQGQGDVAGSAHERSTQVARQRKDANKASRANHGRREGRAKKIARAGFAG